MGVIQGCLFDVLYSGMLDFALIRDSNEYIQHTFS